MPNKALDKPDVELGVLAVSVPVAGKALGLGRNASYDAVKRNEIPAKRIGRRLIVPLEALKRMLIERSS